MSEEIDRPRLLKSHEYFHSKYGKTLYIVRDPRDVCVSYYYFHKRSGKIPIDYPIGDYVPKFIQGSLDRYGTWEDHVAGWLRARSGNHDFMFIRYEDILRATEDALSRIALFMGKNLPQEQVRRIVASCSSARMRELELRAGTNWVDGSDSSIPFVRNAQSGTWIRELPLHDAKKIERKWNVVMSEVGYRAS